VRAPHLPSAPSPHPFVPPILASNARMEIHLTFTSAMNSYLTNYGQKKLHKQI
jgi:hypothetical protein